MAPSNEEHPGPPYEPNQINLKVNKKARRRTHIEPEYDSVYIRSLSVLDHEKV